MSEQPKNKRSAGINTLEDLFSRCERNEMTRCLLWPNKGYGAVWIPTLKQAHSVTAAFTLLTARKLKTGQQWYATCGNVRCVEHRAIGTSSDAMRAIRPTLTPIHKARITAAVRKAKGKYSPELAADIRNSTDTLASAAARTGLDMTTISAVRRGKLWAESTVSSSVFSWRPAA